jgi:putative ABC transport system permease protein
VLNVTFKSLWARKRRLAGTFVAVLLGVAFLSGTLVLGDTLRVNFDRLFTTVTRGTSAEVRSATELGGGRMGSQRGTVDASLVTRVRGVEGVAKAEVSIAGYGALLDKHGKAIGGNGPPQLAGNWIDDADLNPYRIAEGRAPRAADEVVINRGAAKQAGARVGGLATVQTPVPVVVRVVGIATFGGADGFGSATFVAFTPDEAARLIFDRPGQVSSIVVKAAAGVSQSQLVANLRPALPHGVEAITGTRLTKENISEINNRFLKVLRSFLVVFAGIALLVATFSIYNTFAIIAAQRARESALLRALGATRRQVLSAVVVEALIIGVLASIAGVIGGVAVAGLLKGMFDAFGFALPAGGLAFTGTTAVVSFVVGVLVTVVAAIAPAVRTSRVRPLAALRDTAAEAPRVSPLRAGTGAALTALGVAVVLFAVLRDGAGVLASAGLGALLTIVGVVVFGPVIAGPLTAALGQPLARLRGITGDLARRNAMRNPRRTSATAAALLVGVAVATMFTVFAASLKTSVANSVSRSFGGDLVITGGRFGRPTLSPQLAFQLGRAAEVKTAIGLGVGAVRLDGHDKRATVADAAHLDDVVDLNVVSGSLKTLGAQKVAVSKQLLDDNHWRLGSALPATFLDGATARLTVGAVYKNRDVVDDVVLETAAWAPHAVQSLDSQVLVKLRPGVGLTAGRKAVERVAAAFGGPTVQDRREFVAAESGNVNRVLGLVYVMLALAVIIALMGIANTLSLSIHERTRELGLLRALGQTRSQTRSMVRWESVLISTFGAVGGLGVGVFLGWALTKAASAAAGITSFAAPVGQLVFVLLLGAVAGVVAGLRPARRAAKLHVLDAIADS